MAVLDYFKPSKREIEFAGDQCTDEGARKLQEKIEAYWRERGYAPPQFKTISAGFVPAMRSARTDLRSDMVNGFPTRRASEKPRALPSPEDK